MNGRGGKDQQGLEPERARCRGRMKGSAYVDPPPPSQVSQVGCVSCRVDLGQLSNGHFSFLDPFYDSLLQFLAVPSNPSSTPSLRSLRLFCHSLTRPWDTGNPGSSSSHASQQGQQGRRNDEHDEKLWMVAHGPSCRLIQNAKHNDCSGLGALQPSLGLGTKAGNPTYMHTSICEPWRSLAFPWFPWHPQ